MNWRIQNIKNIIQLLVMISGRAFYERNLMMKWRRTNAKK
jgi:hypothetical protein